MARWWIGFLLGALIALAFGFSYTGDGSDGFVAAESVTSTNMNEIDTALDTAQTDIDALEAGTTIASGVTRDVEWDTLAEINTASTDTDAVLDTDIGDTVQAYNANLVDLADGSLSGSKIGTGLDITTATAGTLATARMHADATLDSEWDSAAKINAATTDDDFVMTQGVQDIDLTGSASFSGTLQGLVATTLITSAANSPTSSTLRGGLFQCTNAGGCDITLPTAVSGYNACWYDNNGGGVITIDAAAGDVIILDGVPQPTAEAIDSAGARGDFICILALDATNWVTLGRSGTFIAGGAD